MDSERRTFVSYGQELDDLEDLLLTAQWGDSTLWTMNRLVRPGDRIVFYFRKPYSSFVAVGTASEAPAPNDDVNSRWYGKYMGEVKDIRMLPRPLSFQRAKEAMPEWPWLRYPRGEVQVPQEVVGELSRQFDEGFLRGH